MERINGNNIIGTAVIPTALAGFYWDEEAESAARKRGEAEERDRMKRDMLNPPDHIMAEERAMYAAMETEITKLMVRGAPETAVSEARKRWENKIENHWLAYCSRVAGKRSEHKVNGEE